MGIGCDGIWKYEEMVFWRVEHCHQHYIWIGPADRFSDGYERLSHTDYKSRSISESNGKRNYIVDVGILQGEWDKYEHRTGRRHAG